MATSSPAGTTSSSPAEAPVRNPLFSALIGLTSAAIFLQSVWAGMIIREGKDYDATWVTVHDWGARAALLLALAATVVAFVKLRSRRDLLIGAGVLTVLIFLESYIGGIIGDNPSAIAFHIPLAFAIVILAVWLPLRSRHRG